MHYPRTEHDCIDFYGMSIDPLERLPDGCMISNVEHGLDYLETRYALSYIAVGQRILVAGAGMGGQMALLASKYGVENVIGYEANPRLVELARANVAVRGRQLDLRHGAVGLSSGTVPFYVLPHNWPASTLVGDSINQSEAELIQVPMVDINTVIRTEHITALILDIEGYERQLLTSLHLARLQTLIVEFHVPTEQVPLLLQHVTSSGFVIREVEGRGSATVVCATKRKG